jgi:hypothetical protein
MIARTFLSVKRGHRGEGGHEGFERAAGDVRESRAGSDRGKEHRTEVTEERGHGGFERVGADVRESRAGKGSMEGASHRGHRERERGHGGLLSISHFF